MRTVSHSLSDVGRKRPHNEDAFVADDVLGLYIVADGVGGQAKGEVASSEAVDQVRMWVRRHLAEIEGYLAEGTDDGVVEVRRLLEAGVQQACYMLFSIAEIDPEKKGMSTTMSVLFARGGHAILAQVGDSRVYRRRGDEVAQLTEDHTLINYKLKHGLITPQEAAEAGGKNVITRAVGHKDYVQVDTFAAGMVVGDRYLLCTDGLHGYLAGETELRAILEDDPAEAVRKAVALANDRGGRDNVTCVIVSVAA